MQTNHDFDLVFKSFDVINRGSFNLKINYNIIKKGDSNQNDEFVKIIKIKYIFNLQLIDKNKLISYKEFTLEDISSFELDFVNVNKMNVHKSILLDIPDDIRDKIIEAHFKKNFLILKINTWINYELYTKIQNHFILINPSEIINKFIHDDNSEYGIKINCDKITELIEKNNISKKMRIEIPIPIDSKIKNPLTEAMENLKSAINSYIHGNIEGFTNSLRNAVTNDLTEYDNPKSPNRKRVLKKNIIDFCLNNIPKSEEKYYRDILRNLGSMISSLLKIINIFIHEDAQKIDKWPFAGDLELMYLSISIIYRYLHRITINKLHEINL